MNGSIKPSGCTGRLFACKGTKWPSFRTFAHHQLEIVISGWATRKEYGEAFPEKESGLRNKQVV
jgi:hypothetical protein